MWTPGIKESTVEEGTAAGEGNVEGVLALDPGLKAKETNHFFNERVVFKRVACLIFSSWGKVVGQHAFHRQELPQSCMVWSDSSNEAPCG